MPKASAVVAVLGPISWMINKNSEANYLLTPPTRSAGRSPEIRPKNPLSSGNALYDLIMNTVHEERSSVLLYSLDNTTSQDSHT